MMAESQQNPPIRAVFLDRDGTLIVDQHYPRDADKVELLPNAIEALKLFTSKGYKLFVVSNQSGVGRGIISAEQFKGVHKRTCELLQSHGIEIEQFAYCFHRPEDECPCRKPNTGMVSDNHEGTPISLAESVMVGDRPSDIGLGNHFGGKSFLVLTGKGKEALSELEQQKDWQFTACQDLLEVAQTLAPC